MTVGAWNVGEVSRTEQMPSYHHTVLNVGCILFYLQTQGNLLSS